jgi:hypothetical protein
MSETEIHLHGRAEGLLPTVAGEHEDLAEPAGADAKSRTSPSRLVWLLQRVFSFPAMLGSALVGAVFYVARGFVVDPDIWWHIKVGEAVLATHQFPHADIYSFTVPGAPWMAYEWLGEVPLAVAARIGGVTALDVLLLVLGAAIVTALYVFATIRCGNSKAAFVAVLLLFPIANASFTLRPQMLGYIFLVFTLIALELARQGKSWVLWVLPPVFLLWVNIHGSFVVGLGVIFVYWLSGLKGFRVGGIEGRAWQPAERVRLEFVFLLCVAVLPITPYGSRLAVYPVDMAFSQPVNVASIMEWQPMPMDMVGGKIFLGLLLGFLVLQMFFQFVWRVEEVVLYLAGTFLAALHLRFILLFVPFFVPIFAVVLARWVPKYERPKDKYILNAVLMASLVAAFIHYFPSKADFREKVAGQFPVHAMEYLQQNAVPGPMYNTYGYGGYLVWAGQKVFIDGRGDIYERGGVLADYMHIIKMKPGALAVLQNYQVQSCLLERDEPLSTLLSTAPGWKRVYVDKTSALFVRTENARQELRP